jgi:hypothetical protein
VDDLAPLDVASDVGDLEPEQVVDEYVKPASLRPKLSPPAPEKTSIAAG